MSLHRNALWNLAGALVPLATGAALIPYLVKQAGVEAFGVLTLVWALIGYFSLFDFGLGRALTQKVSQKLASNCLNELPAFVKSGLSLTTATGVIGGLVLAAVAKPLAVDVLKVSVPLQGEVFHALLIAAAGVPVTTATVGLRGVLEAFEDFKNVNLLRMLLGCGTFGLPALSVFCFGPSLVLMVSGLMVARLLFAAAHWWLVRRRMKGDLRAGTIRRHELRELLFFGAWMTVSNIVSPLLVTADRFVISAAVGAAMVAYYAVPSELIARMLIVPGALAGALFPRLAALLLLHDMTAARALYRRCIAVVAAVMLPLCLALAFGAHRGLSIWLGEDFADRSAPIVAILAVGLWLNGIAFIPFAAIQAAGLARVTAQLHLLEAVLYFPLLWYGMQALGLVGAAIAWTCRVGVDLAMLLVSTERLLFGRNRIAPRMRHNFPSTEPQRIDTP